MNTKMTVNSNLPFDVSQHPNAKSVVSRSIIERMSSDLKEYANQTNNSETFYVRT